MPIPPNIMDTNWIDFNPSENFSPLDNNLGFLEPHASSTNHSTPNEDDPEQKLLKDSRGPTIIHHHHHHHHVDSSENKDEPATNDYMSSLNGNNNLLNSILDIQKWSDFGYNPQDAQATTTTNKTLNNADNNMMKVRLQHTPKSLDLSQSYANNRNPVASAYSTPYDANATSAFAIDNQNKFFTPLISPAMTPLESMMLDDHAPALHNTRDEFFTPLTSPAINPMNHPSPKTLLQLSEEPSANPRQKSKTASFAASKRSTRTSSKGRILKTKPSSKNNSPIIKATHSPIVRAGAHVGAVNASRRPNVNTHVLENDTQNIDLDLQRLENFSLPDNSIGTNIGIDNAFNGDDFLGQQVNEAQQLYSASVNGSQTSVNSLFQHSQSQVNGTGTDINNNNSKPATPATLMNLKFQHSNHNDLHEKTSQNSKQKTSKSMIKEITFQASAATPASIAKSDRAGVTRKASSSSISSSTSSSKKAIQTSTPFSSFKTYKQKSGGNKTIMDSVIAHQSQFKLNLNNSNSKSDTSAAGEKKSSHREAEKGRRDRMNIAIHDLALLIPEELTSSVAVPSKATTVELASQYIQSLVDEVERLNKVVEDKNEEHDATT
ncbi:hypothetical protein DASC09_061460 [Saccharomycopsis crataegensis]|uniref:BHLH domain-containing protein n=1 Tax=Saccharomycopsis crataegensis TaxID=43959 RepID=A0AAV5QW54_9ASCO|nr:hypothetical protein DASC09_061460 [Saccharomycopsis crataegensis]